MKKRAKLVKESLNEKIGSRDKELEEFMTDMKFYLMDQGFGYDHEDEAKDFLKFHKDEIKDAYKKGQKPEEIVDMLLFDDNKQDSK